jgi:hypothetical protein
VNPESCFLVVNIIGIFKNFHRKLSTDWNGPQKYQVLIFNCLQNYEVKMSSDKSMYSPFPISMSNPSLLKKKRKLSSGSGAKSYYTYMRKTFLIYEEMCEHLVIYEEAGSQIRLCTRSLLNLLTYEEFF